MIPYCHPVSGVGSDNNKKRLSETIEQPFFYALNSLNGKSLFLITVTVAAHELVNTSCSIHQFRFTCIERVRSI